MVSCQESVTKSVRVCIAENPWSFTGDSKDVKSSDGLTVNLNCPFLLSKRRRMVFEGGMSTSVWENLQYLNYGLFPHAITQAMSRNLSRNRIFRPQHQSCRMISKVAELELPSRKPSAAVHPRPDIAALF